MAISLLKEYYDMFAESIEISIGDAKEFFGILASAEVEFTTTSALINLGQVPSKEKENLVNKILNNMTIAKEALQKKCSLCDPKEALPDDDMTEDQLQNSSGYTKAADFIYDALKTVNENISNNEETLGSFELSLQRSSFSTEDITNSKRKINIETQFDPQKSVFKEYYDAAVNGNLNKSISDPRQFFLNLANAEVGYNTISAIINMHTIAADESKHVFEDVFTDIMRGLGSTRETLEECSSKSYANSKDFNSAVFKTVSENTLQIRDALLGFLDKSPIKEEQGYQLRNRYIAGDNRAR